jgi:hypothetical protein
VGRASSRNHSRAAVAATQLARRSRSTDDPTRLHPERDALWFVHGRELTQATDLLRRIEQLTESEMTRLCETMQRIGQSVGLHGPWHIVGEQPRLAYCARFEERMPLARNEIQWRVLQDEFDGTLTDGLPEPRYLGRLLQGLAAAGDGEYAAI